MPAVSVLVPCYNVEKFIHQCMDSIVGQTLTDLEIICLNDGSTDGTLAILQEYAAKDPRVRIIDKPNSGYGDSMNRGLEAATGEYIGIVESDDWTERDMFESLYTLAKKYDSDMVKSGYYLYWSAPHERNDLSSVPAEYADRLLLNEEYADCSKFAPSIWSGIYRRDMLVRWNIGFLTTPGASFQDTSFYIKTWIASRSIYVTSKAWLHYRQDNMNSSVKSRNKILEIVQEYHSIEEFMKRWDVSELWYSAIHKMKFVGYRWNFNRLDYNGRKQFLPVMHKEFKDILESGNISLFSHNNLKRLRLIAKYPLWFFFSIVLQRAFKEITLKALKTY